MIARDVKINGTWRGRHTCSIEKIAAVKPKAEMQHILQHPENISQQFDCSLAVKQ